MRCFSTFFVLLLGLYSVDSIAEIPSPPMPSAGPTQTMAPPPMPSAIPMRSVIPAPPPAPTPVASAPPVAAGGAMAHITASGTVLTLMPCSFTGALRERYFTVTYNIQIGYIDAYGDYRVFPYTTSRSFEQPAGGSGGFALTLDVMVPGAERITAITANVTVSILTAYGIHGWFTFQYVGSGASPSDTLDVLTRRAGQENTVPGATTLCGLLPDFETMGMQPGDPVPTPAAPIVQPAPIAAGTSYCNCFVNCIGNWNGSNVQVAGVAAADCNHTNTAMDQAEKMACPNFGVGTRGACNYFAPIVAISAPSTPSVHCHCDLRCPWRINSQGIDIYGLNEGECSRGNSGVDTAARQSCNGSTPASPPTCVWVQ